jgi:hypothetical protein
MNLRPASYGFLHTMATGMDLFRPDELPVSFAYPAELLRFVELRLTNLQPWWILDGGRLRSRQQGLHTRYPGRRVVVFAEHQNTQDVACFDLDTGGVSIIRDWEPAGNEQRETFPTVDDWLWEAFADCLEFGRALREHFARLDGRG